MPKPFTVRRFRIADLDRILEIEDASFGAEAYDRNLFAEFFRQSGELFLVAERGGRICGYILACTYRRALWKSAELVSVAVVPSARGKGAASALMDSTLRRLRLRRVGRIGLMVRLTNQPARRFYEKYGFERVRTVRRYYEDGADALLMRKRL